MKYFKDKILTSLEDLKKHGIKRGISHLVNSSKVINTYVDSCVDKDKKRMASQSYVLDDDRRFYHGQVIVCKHGVTVSINELKGDEKKYKKLCRNSKYKVIGQNKTKKFFTLEDLLDGTIVKVSLAIISSRFDLNHCATCHSEQGATINEPFIITDLSTIRSNRFLYSAVSRCSNMSHVYFLEMDTTDLQLDEFFKEKIRGYKYQDAAKKRVFSDD